MCKHIHLQKIFFKHNGCHSSEHTSLVWKFTQHFFPTNHNYIEGSQWLLTTNLAVQNHSKSKISKEFTRKGIYQYKRPGDVVII